MKRDPRLHGLSEDHHHALALARNVRLDVERGDGGEARARIEAAFASELEPHFIVEEEVLVPALHAAGLGALADRLGEEHAALRAVYAEVGAGEPTAPGRFAELLVAHVRFEERELFQVAQRSLPDDVLAEVQRRTPRREG